MMIWAWMGLAQAATLVDTWDAATDALLFSHSRARSLGMRRGALRSVCGCHGSHACGTGLTGSYTNNAQSFLEMPSKDLAALGQPMLVWKQWLGLEAGDLGEVQAFRGGQWETIEPVYGYPQATNAFSGRDLVWKSVAIDLDSLTNLSAIRFRFTSDASVTDDGWFVTMWSSGMETLRLRSWTTSRCLRTPMISTGLTP